MISYSNSFLVSVFFSFKFKIKKKTLKKEKKNAIRKPENYK